MLGELQSGNDLVVSDLEAGVGTLLRMHPGHADIALIVADASAKSLEVAKRAASVASERASVIVVANRIGDEADRDAVGAALDGFEVVAVPDDPSVADADRRGVAPIDHAPGAPAVRAIAALGELLGARLDRGAGGR